MFLHLNSFKLAAELVNFFACAAESLEMVIVTDFNIVGLYCLEEESIAHANHCYQEEVRMLLANQKAGVIT